MNEEALRPRILYITDRAAKIQEGIGRYIDHYSFDDNNVTVIVSNGRFKIPVELLEKEPDDTIISGNILPTFVDFGL